MWILIINRRGNLNHRRGYWIFQKKWYHKLTGPTNGKDDTMTENNIGRNIRKLREARQVTQEQLAQALNLSFQAVSKWETGVTVPDTLTLPRIAAYFDVTIDELFRPEPGAYSNNAQRLMAVYEASHDQDDFIRADAEFKKLFRSGSFTRDDERLYGVLYEYHMYYCRNKALEQYEKLIAGSERDAAYRGARTQRLYMLSNLGRGTQCVEEERARVLADSEDPENRFALVAALYFAGRYEETLTAVGEAQEHLGELEGGSFFYLYAGDACEKLGHYEEAFAYWDRALELGPEYADPLYSMALCFHRQGKYAEEISAWERVVDFLAKRGYVHELAFPQEQLRKARESYNAPPAERSEP